MSDEQFPFEKLEVYHLAVQLAGVIREILKQIPAGNGDLRNHLGRSERSIRLNTAEGSGRRPAGQKASRYDTARASANECAAALAEVRLFDLADRRLINDADALLRRITRMLTRLIQRWRPEPHSHSQSQSQSQSVVPVGDAVASALPLQQYEARTSYPHRGDYLPPLAAGSLDGEILTLGQAAVGGRQLLLVFNTTCQFCRATLPHWKSIMDRLDAAPSTPVERIGISLDPHPETRAYVAQHELNLPVAIFGDRRQVRLYRAATVPQTLVLDSAGRVLYGRGREGAGCY